MKTSDFDYVLPPELIAQEPPKERGASRMLVLYRANGRIEHRMFSDLPEYLKAGDVLVVNDTKVMPARLYGKKEATGGKVEVLLTENLSGNRWKCLIKPTTRLRDGAVIILADGDLKATLIRRLETGGCEVELSASEPVLDIMKKYGHVPLPPYIKRMANKPDSVQDVESYQTVYAKNAGAVAAPTAGLHFTPDMFDRLAQKHVEVTRITLHVGPGTFKPVKAENMEDHKMDPERYVISEDSAKAINRAKQEGRRVIATGTTVVRTLEAASDQAGRVIPGSGYSDIFIYPPYTFKVPDVILTNFHLPRSTLLALASAFCGSGSSADGRKMLMETYQQAISNGYRFYSYGDCMLVI